MFIALGVCFLLPIISIVLIRTCLTDDSQDNHTHDFVSVVEVTMFIVSLFLATISWNWCEWCESIIEKGIWLNIMCVHNYIAIGSIMLTLILVPDLYPGKGTGH